MAQMITEKHVVTTEFLGSLTEEERTRYLQDESTYYPEIGIFGLQRLDWLISNKPDELYTLTVEGGLEAHLNQTDRVCFNRIRYAKSFLGAEERAYVQKLIENPELETPEDEWDLQLKELSGFYRSPCLIRKELRPEFGPASGVWDRDAQLRLEYLISEKPRKMRALVEMGNFIQNLNDTADAYQQEVKKWADSYMEEYLEEYRESHDGEEINEHILFCEENYAWDTARELMREPVLFR